jgi:transcriptional regulator with XRE-family HTH domain
MTSKLAKRHSFLVDNIAFLLKEYQIDLKNLAAATGVPAPTLSRIKREGANPTVSTLEPLLDFFRLDLHSLLYEDLQSTDYQKKMASGRLCHIPVRQLDAAWNTKAKVERFISGSGLNPECAFAIEINNNSMAPIFQNNTTVIIDSSVTPKEGDFVLCLLEKSQKPCFRQYFSELDVSYFKPLNPEFGEMRAHEHFEILGVVIKSIEDFR